MGAYLPPSKQCDQLSTSPWDTAGPAPSGDANASQVTAGMWDAGGLATHSSFHCFPAHCLLGISW